ncbi:MAG: hypothetical protein ACLTSX_02990 [Collinsella sp.]
MPTKAQFRLEVDPDPQRRVAHGEGYPSITKAAMRGFIKTQRALGMNVVAQRSTYARPHAVATARVWPGSCRQERQGDDVALW